MKDQDKEKLFKKIYIDFADPIYRTCCSYLVDESDRKDLFQEILSNIWKGLDRLRNHNALKTWTYRVSHNTAMGFVIKKRKLRFVDPHPEHLLNNSEDDYSAENSYEIDSQVEVMFQCINKLPTKDKAIITMVLEELSVNEISDVIGLKPGNIRVRIHRIKKNLRSLMEESNGIQ